MTNVTFYADTAGLTFFAGPDGQMMSWVHALPGGNWKHPVYGDLKFDDVKIDNYVTSVVQKYRQVDPDIDYDHKQDAAMGNRAAGWVKNAESRPGKDGKDLYLLVEWTPQGYKSVKEKEYRYFSSELADEWTDQAGKVYKDVVFGGGITNRPYMKNLVPLNLSELTFADPKADPVPTDNKGEQVDPKELRRKLGLREDATDAEVDTKLSEVAKLGTPPANTDPNMEALKALAENNPVVKAVLAQMEETNKLLKEEREARKLAETQNRLRTLASGKFSFTAAQLNDATALMVGAPQQFNDKLFGLLKSIVDDGLTQLGESGSSGPSDRDEKTSQGGDAVAKFTDAVTKAETDRKLSYPDALEFVARENPQLYADYRKAVYIPADA